MATIGRIDAFHDEMTAWRRDIHAHPELGFEETRTAALVADKLASFGIEVAHEVGKTGVVGTLTVGEGGGAVGLRADLDALPITEANDVPYRSRHDGKMHACGHDGHTTMLLGAARYLAETRNFAGTVRFIFQPAEEGLGGARAMIADGLFERFPVDAVFGLHNRPGLPVGRFAIRPGPMMAGGAYFDITVTGKGAHGGRPESSIDPVLVAAHIATALQSIVARNANPKEPVVLSVTQIHGGDAYNVIPSQAVLRGTARAFTKETLALIETNMGRLAARVAEGFGARAELDFRVVFLPLVNHAEETGFAADVAAEVAGADNVNRNGDLITASEDFSFMLDALPGAYIILGNGDRDGVGGGLCEVHNPGYDFNDEILPIGASYFARVAESWLNR